MFRLVLVSMGGLAVALAPTTPCGRRAAVMTARRAAAAADDVGAALASAIAAGRAEAALAALEATAENATIAAADAIAIVDLCATPDAPRDAGGAAPDGAAPEETRLLRCYEALAARGRMPSFASCSRPGALPVRARVNELTADDFAAVTGLSQSSLRPSADGENRWRLAGAGVLAAEGALSALSGAPLPALLAATAAVAALDTLLLRGALVEAAARVVTPGAAARVVRHEAGHLLLAHVLGCPVQACCLSAAEALRREAREGLSARDVLAGGGARTDGALGAGTVFFDPILAASARTGKVPVSIVDRRVARAGRRRAPPRASRRARLAVTPPPRADRRYSIIVMGGIAAEAMCYGAAEGGRGDEQALEDLLVERLGAAAGFDRARVAAKARWAAANAVLLLRAREPAFERLVASLTATRAESIGGVLLAIDAG